MSKFRLISKIIIAGTFVVWIVWDVVLTQNNEWTLSKELTTFAKAHTVFPYLIGFICGHWFLSSKTPWKSGWMWAIPTFLGLILWDYLHVKLELTENIFRFPGLMLLFGLLAGATLWGQADKDSPL